MTETEEIKPLKENHVNAKQEYEMLLRKLMAVDLESPEAEAIRDQMDGPGLAMTPEERHEMMLLSRDLDAANDRAVALEPK